LQSPTGDHLRHVPADLAAHLVATGVAEIAHANGRVKSIRLTASIESQVQRIGEPIKPTGPTSVRFIRKVQTEAGTYWEHHPRALEPPD
jgi:hypothetical protein